MNNERVTLAQELHDGIAQDLVVLGFSMDQVIASSAEPAVKSALREIRFTTTELIERVRRQLHQLRSDEPLASQGERIDTMHETLRIVQEILRNVERHSEATSIEISISDNGRGGVSQSQGSFGLQGLHERIEKLNGEIAIESSTQGTKIGVRIPLD
jgi:signal transduction histidine kinase